MAFVAEGERVEGARARGEWGKDSCHTAVFDVGHVVVGCDSNDVVDPFVARSNLFRIAFDDASKTAPRPCPALAIDDAKLGEEFGAACETVMFFGRARRAVAFISCAFDERCLAWRRL